MNHESSSLLSSDTRAFLTQASKDLYSARKTALETRGLDLDNYTREACQEEQAVLNDITTDSDYRVLGVGASRVAIKLPTHLANDSYTVKLPRYGGTAETSDGLIQNAHERDVFTRASGTQELALVPIISYSESRPWWVMMPTVTPLSESDISEEEQHKRVMTLLMDLEELGFADYLHLAEVSSENTALYEGNLRMFDYGHRALDLDVFTLTEEQVDDLADF